MDEYLCLLLRRDSCIFDGAFSGRVAHIHLVCLFFIALHGVYDHVDENFSSFVTLGHFDVVFCASKRGDIVRCDLRNFV